MKGSRTAYPSYYVVRRTVEKLLTYVALFAALFVIVAPLLLVLNSSLKTRIEILTDPLGLPASPQLDNFAAAIEIGRFGDYLANTVIYSVGTSAGVAILSVMAGYALARLNFRGREAIFIILLLGLTIPFQSIMVPLFYLERDLGLIGTHAGMILAGVSLGLPFGCFLMRSFFRAIPHELPEAARIDGAGEFAILVRIMLPLAIPGLAILLLLQFLATWKEFLLPLLLVPGEDVRPASLGLIFFSGRYNTDNALLSAAMVITNVPIIVLFLLTQRQFVKGISAGSLRG
jgi:raffinose/stachyose/melibiose transport system permease protein